MIMAYFDTLEETIADFSRSVFLIGTFFFETSKKVTPPNILDNDATDIREYRRPPFSLRAAMVDVDEGRDAGMVGEGAKHFDLRTEQLEVLRSEGGDADRLDGVGAVRETVGAFMHDAESSRAEQLAELVPFLENPRVVFEAPVTVVGEIPSSPPSAPPSEISDCLGRLADNFRNCRRSTMPYSTDAIPVAFAGNFLRKRARRPTFGFSIFFRAYCFRRR
mmetsp:Transcript_37241/g.86859  ORF Transcript_37241/g.86859 Transcript_37241/m.86859 type:complete len:220 (-) Transcript_37241:649-1308(-)